MTYVFDEEGKGMPVKQIGWKTETSIVAIILALGIAFMGASQWLLNRRTTDSIIFLASQQAKTAEQARVLERRLRRIETGVEAVRADSTSAVPSYLQIVVSGDVVTPSVYYYIKEDCP